VPRCIFYAATVEVELSCRLCSDCPPPSYVMNSNLQQRSAQTPWQRKPTTFATPTCTQGHPPNLDHSTNGETLERQAAGPSCTRPTLMAPQHYPGFITCARPEHHQKGYVVYRHFAIPRSRYLVQSGGLHFIITAKANDVLMRYRC
jgi:hypothetical protein